ncbi:phosphomevalonate kinase [Agromyces atrinae]|uniref:Phosphomevalonate kinase n=1 Tax=Agromyces atrinae TaxID=592376 RepID=A0A4Q2M4Y2_9MICO|nr:phosphomevalonate kinase [Agromyces atrinae]NYD67250.1 phosphomevalonate kinase [Agromyces atrinae]RXZ86918.1 phosphomevalonate kinase [Agromyces atrinae]
MIEASAPGKLFVAGEYAVVEPGGSAILVAVDRFVSVSGVDAEVGSVQSSHYGAEPRPWGVEAHDVVSAAIEVVGSLARDHGRTARPLALTIDSGLDDSDGSKYGLGSSAAVVVAIVRVLAEANDVPLDAQTTLRLALLATWAVNPAASGGDVAASSLGGWIRYRSADAAELLDRRERFGVAEALTGEWGSLAATPLPAPEGEPLLVGWTGSPASTAALVGRSRQGRAVRDADYRAFFAESDAAVSELGAAIARGDDDARASGIRHARAALAHYATLTGIEIETPALTELCAIAERHGAPAKSSGAGGGDCGIALAGRAVDRERLRAEWLAADIRPLDLRAWPHATTTTEAPAGVAATPRRTP